MNRGEKQYSSKNVLEAARDRLRWTFDEFGKICVAFSGGKDSTVLLHLALEVAAEKGNRRVGAMMVDLEGQYRATIQHVKEMFDKYTDRLDPYWICLPLNLRNAVSCFQPYWCCWEPGEEERWVRDIPQHPSVISDPNFFPFFRHRMEFEEFVPAFNEWYAGAEHAAQLVAIRSDESLHRYKAVKRAATVKKCAYKDVQWTAKQKASSKSVTVYPIYDWRFEDIWKYIYDYDLEYNRLYDYMHLAGVQPVDMRICQPYGDDQRKGLDQFHKIEPDTWFRIVKRVEGANWGALYAGQKLLGYKGGMQRPPTFSTWKQYADFLLRTMPENMRQVYERRIQVFLDWWSERGYPSEKVPDTGDRKLEGKKQQPSWRRICLSILKMDMGKSLSFGYHEGDKQQLIKERWKNL